MSFIYWEIKINGANKFCTNSKKTMLKYKLRSKLSRTTLISIKKKIKKIKE